MQKDPRAWWRRAFAQGHYSHLRYGVCFFLQFSSGNAHLERVFGNAERVFCKKRRHGLDIARHMLLHENAHLIQMEGYWPPGHDEVYQSETLDAEMHE